MQGKSNLNLDRVKLVLDMFGYGFTPPKNDELMR